MRALSGTPLAIGSHVTTQKGSRALVRTGDGAAVFLRGETEIALADSGIELERGEIWLDAPRAEGEAIACRLGKHVVSASDAGLSVRRQGDDVNVYVARGLSILTSPGGRVEINAGEEGAAKGAAKPTLAPIAFWQDWTGGMGDQRGVRGGAGSGSGRLYGMDPNAPPGQAAKKLGIAKQVVKAVVRDGVTETEVDQTFSNPGAAPIEGWYWFTVPLTATVTSSLSRRTACSSRGRWWRGARPAPAANAHGSAAAPVAAAAQPVVAPPLPPQEAKLGRDAVGAKPADASGVHANGTPPTPPTPLVSRRPLARCSDSASRPLAERIVLWQKRLRAARGAADVVAQYEAARAGCELPDWRDQAALLDLVQQKVDTEQAAEIVLSHFAGEREAQRFVARAILRHTVDVRLATVVSRILFGGVDRGKVDRDMLDLPTPEKKPLYLRTALQIAPGDPQGDVRLVRLLAKTGERQEALSTGDAHAPLLGRPRRAPRDRRRRRQERDARGRGDGRRRDGTP